MDAECLTDGKSNAGRGPAVDRDGRPIENPRVIHQPGPVIGPEAPEHPSPNY